MQIFNNTLVYIFSGFQSWVAGITIWPFIFSKKEMKGNMEHRLHERIHLRQQLECLLIPYPVMYFGNYFYNRIIKKMNHMTAYKNICFEKEAYAKQFDADYLSIRKAYAWKNYTNKKSEENKA